MSAARTQMNNTNYNVKHRKYNDSKSESMSMTTYARAKVRAAIFLEKFLPLRSFSFFRPGNTILVPGMYFFGLVK